MKRTAGRQSPARVAATRAAAAAAQVAAVRAAANLQTCSPTTALERQAEQVAATRGAAVLQISSAGMDRQPKMSVDAAVGSTVALVDMIDAAISSPIIGIRTQKVGHSAQDVDEKLVARASRTRCVCRQDAARCNSEKAARKLEVPLVRDRRRWKMNLERKQSTGRSNLHRPRDDHPSASGEKLRQTTAKAQSKVKEPRRTSSKAHHRKILVENSNSQTKEESQRPFNSSLRMANFCEEEFVNDESPMFNQHTCIFRTGRTASRRSIYEDSPERLKPCRSLKRHTSSSRLSSSKILPVSKALSRTKSIARTIQDDNERLKQPKLKETEEANKISHEPKKAWVGLTYCNGKPFVPGMFYQSPVGGSVELEKTSLKVKRKSEIDMVGKPEDEESARRCDVHFLAPTPYDGECVRMAKSDVLRLPEPKQSCGGRTVTEIFDFCVACAPACKTDAIKGPSRLKRQSHPKQENRHLGDVSGEGSFMSRELDIFAVSTKRATENHKKNKQNKKLEPRIKKPKKVPGAVDPPVKASRSHYSGCRGSRHAGIGQQVDRKVAQREPDQASVSLTSLEPRLKKPKKVPGAVDPPVKASRSHYSGCRGSRHAGIGQQVDQKIAQREPDQTSVSLTSTANIKKENFELGALHGSGKLGAVHVTPRKTKQNSMRHQSKEELPEQKPRGGSPSMNRDTRTQELLTNTLQSQRADNVDYVRGTKKGHDAPINKGSDRRETTKSAKRSVESRPKSHKKNKTATRNSSLGSECYRSNGSPHSAYRKVNGQDEVLPHRRRNTDAPKSKDNCRPKEPMPKSLKQTARAQRENRVATIAKEKCESIREKSLQNVIGKKNETSKTFGTSEAKDINPESTNGGNLNLKSKSTTSQNNTTAFNCQRKIVGHGQRLSTSIPLQVRNSGKTVFRRRKSIKTVTSCANRKMSPTQQPLAKSNQGIKNIRAKRRSKIRNGPRMKRRSSQKESTNKHDFTASC